MATAAIRDVGENDVAEARKRFVVVPNDNAFNAGARTSSSSFLAALSRAGTPRPRNKGIIETADIGAIKVLTRVNLNETTLVEITGSQALELSHTYPGLRIKEEVVLELFRTRMFSLDGEGRAPARGSRAVTVAVLDGEGRPVPNARVDILVNEARGEVLENLTTDADGLVTFKLAKRTAALDYIAVTPHQHFWSKFAYELNIERPDPRIDITLDRIDPAFRDAVSRLTTAAVAADGEGVKVAIIDAGTSLPAAIAVEAGKNFVDQDLDDVSDNGTGHGTHVAGIVHRLAPGAMLRIYRVCSAGTSTANEMAIAKAIRDAVDENCDIINLSLGQSSEPLSVTREIRRARALGTVVVAAAGNDWGSEVAYPARTPNVIAVSACGDIAGAPDSSISRRFNEAPPVPEGSIFFARFANYGPEIDFIAPGVAVVSNVSPDALGVMDGTSMAAPVVSGLIARLLSADAELLTSDRTQQRSDDIVSACHKAAEAFGFGRDFEGSGMLRL